MPYALTNIKYNGTFTPVDTEVSDLFPDDVLASLIEAGAVGEAPSLENTAALAEFVAAKDAEIAALHEALEEAGVEVPKKSGKGKSKTTKSADE